MHLSRATPTPGVVSGLVPNSLWRTIIRDTCAVMRRKRIRRCVCISVSLVCLLCLILWTSTAHTILHYLDCSDYHSKVYLEELCQNYSNGWITGSLCKPLCVTKEIQFQRCLGHGVKLHVLQAVWNGNIIIIKSPKALGSRLAKVHLEDSGKDLKLTRKEFIAQANVSLFDNQVMGTTAQRTVEVIEAIFTECDVGGDGVLSYSEALPCWQLVETDEYVLFSLLRGMSAIPNIYGTCGTTYAVQYAASESYFGIETSMSEARSWNLRAKLALALLEMIESVEHTPYGTLYLCDIQESNFGMVQNEGRLVAKAIDVDISWFEAAMTSAVEFEKNKTCSDNSDCDFVSCQVECIHNKCSGQLASNNLMTFCLRIFKQRHTWHFALLMSPPEDIRFQLEVLLDKCAHPGKRETHIPHQLLTQLRTVLQDSIYEPALPSHQKEPQLGVGQHDKLWPP